MQVDKIAACKPIETLVNTLLKKGFAIAETKISDYHFHELSFILKGKYTSEIDHISHLKIKKLDDATFTCLCHWSTVNLIYE